MAVMRRSWTMTADFRHPPVVDTRPHRTRSEYQPRGPSAMRTFWTAATWLSTPRQARPDSRFPRPRVTSEPTRLAWSECAHTVVSYDSRFMSASDVRVAG